MYAYVCMRMHVCLCMCASLCVYMCVCVCVKHSYPEAVALVPKSRYILTPHLQYGEEKIVEIISLHLFVTARIAFFFFILYFILFILTYILLFNHPPLLTVTNSIDPALKIRHSTLLPLHNIFWDICTIEIKNKKYFDE